MMKHFIDLFLTLLQAASIDHDIEVAFLLHGIFFLKLLINFFNSNILNYLK